MPFSLYTAATNIKELPPNATEVFKRKSERKKLTSLEEWFCAWKNPLILLRLLHDLPLMQLLKYQKMPLKLFHIERYPTCNIRVIWGLSALGKKGDICLVSEK